MRYTTSLPEVQGMEVWDSGGKAVLVFEWKQTRRYETRMFCGNAGTP